MRLDSKGKVLFQGDLTVGPDRQRNLTAAIGTETAGETSMLLTFFGPTIGGEDTVVREEGLALDLSAALLGGVSYEWRRTFALGETVHATVSVGDCYAKGSNGFAVVVAEFTGTDGELIQIQTATFIERGAQ